MSSMSPILDRPLVMLLVALLSGYGVCVCPAGRVNQVGRSPASRMSLCPHCWPLCWPGGTAATPGRAPAAGGAGSGRATLSKPPRHQTAGGTLWLRAAPPGRCPRRAALGGSVLPPSLCGCHLCLHPLQAREEFKFGWAGQRVQATFGLTSTRPKFDVQGPSMLISHEDGELRCFCCMCLEIGITCHR